MLRLCDGAVLQEGIQQGLLLQKKAVVFLLQREGVPVFTVHDKATPKYNKIFGNKPNGWEYNMFPLFWQERKLQPVVSLALELRFQNPHDIISFRNGGRSAAWAEAER